MRNIVRDHSEIGQTFQLNWDGRDDSGLLLADGEYRMTVQNYEFFFHIDTTFPEVNFSLQDVYQAEEQFDSEGNSLGLFATAQAQLDWSLLDLNYTDSVIEWASASSPSDWQVFADPDPARKEADGKIIGRKQLALSTSDRYRDEVSGRRYRAIAADGAGNRTVVSLEPVAEQLMVVGFGAHRPNLSSALASQLNVLNDDAGLIDTLNATGGWFERLAPIPYAEMGNNDGVAPAVRSIFGETRFQIKETVAARLTSLEVQYRSLDETQWRGSNPDRYFDDARLFSAAPIERSSASEVDIAFHAVWKQPADIDPDRDYVIRLKGLDAAGGEHLSNVFRVRFTEKLSFKGLRRDAAAEDIALIDRLLGGFPSAEDYVLWGRVSSVDPISTVRVLVSSSDDPRYAVEREIGVFNNAINAFAVKTGDLSSCQNYSARVIGIVEPRLDPQSGELLPGRRFESQSGSFQLLCLELAVRVEPVIAAVCNSASPQALRIEFSPQSTDGAPLQLLSLSTEDAQDVLFNVNEPTSAPRPRRGNEPVFNYEFILDTSDMAPGRRTFRARLLNKNDEEITENVSLVIDHVAPQAAINFPAAGDKVCGVPRVVNIDGQSETFNVMSLEGLIQDDVSLGYFLEFNPGSEYNAATARRFHDSNSDLNLNSFQAASAQGPTPVVLDSVEASRPVNRVSPAFSGNRKAGSLGELFNITGENNVRLHVYDRGGHHICTDRSFTFDGNVQLASLSLDRALFSPNQDGVADSVELAYVLDESARLDAEIFAATIGADKVPRITGNVLRVIASDLPVLAGASRVAWDGTDAAGTPLADGLYAIRLSFTDGCGNRRREARFVEVDNTEPALNLLFPLSTSQLPLMTEVQGTVTDKNFNDYRVEVGRGSDPDTWLQIAADRRAVSEAGVLGSWNTFGLQDDYTLRVTAADKVGNRTELRIPLTLTEPLELVSYLEAVEPLFSPNGDGRRERTSIRFGLEQEVVASLGILQQGQVVRELLVEQSFEPGPRALSWNGDDAIGESVADGVYQAQLSVGLASDPLVSQTEQITITVDGGLPTVEITQPGNGFIRPGLPVVGTISDVHLQSYSLSIADNADNPLWEEIASGNLNQLNRSLAPLSAELEGSYVLRVTALDLAENRVEQIIPFTLDKTAPAVSLTVPANNAYVNGQAPLAISAALTEDNPAAYRLEFSAPGSNTATEIASGQDFPLPEVLTQWDVAAVSDGVYNLRFTVEDLAGNTGVVEQLLTIDKTPPVASITTPQNNGYITEGALIEGVASDLNLDEYRIEIAPGAVASAEQYSLLGTGVVPVDQGGLLEISVLPADGEYSLRLQVDDLAGNQSEALVQVVVDTSAPAQVGNLSAAIENDSDVRLNWDDNAESDLAGYFVFRDGVQVTPQPIDVSEYVDVGVAQGRHQYTLRAIDNAGNTSPDSLAAEVVIDLLPPTVSISAPTAGSEVNGLVDIRGTATSLDDFKEYRLYTARGDAPEIRQLLRRSPVPVQAQSLGEWNTISLPEGAAYVITLEGEDINGNIATEQATVSIDNLAPVQPTGLTLTTNGANVNLSWNANPETDLLGYLVFRNDRIANATGTVVGDLQPYVIVPNAYADLTLPDGLYSYTIVAIDDAGNLSEASLPADATIDTRIPQANIVQPTDGIEFEQPLYVLATTQDNDVATVQFQYRALGSSLWIDLEADTELPFDLDFDPSALGLNLGDYELTAVATDQNDQTDANPGFITLKYRDLTAPASAADLLARVSAGDVSLSWSANNDADLAGYHIERVDVDQVTTRLTTDLLQVSSYDDFDLADGVYRYQVIAVDQSGNESNVSEQAVAVIYTPVFEAFPVPTRQTAVTINGRGVTRATVNTTLTNSAGSVELAPLDTDAEGLFVLAASLEPGANRFVVRMTDADGNVSKSASLNIFRGDAPSRPTGLAGSANDTEVSLSWNPNPETDIAGYRVFRNGATALADQAVTGLSATASSAFSGNTGPRAIDGNPSTFWQTPFPYQDQWIAIDWVEPRLLTEIVLNWRYSSGVLSDYDIEADFQGSWVVLQEVRAARRELEQKVLLAAPYMTTKIRLVVRENRFFSLSEIVPVHSPLVEATAFVETAPNGVQEYTVTAVNTLGFESAASAPAELSIGDVTPPEAVTLSAVADGTDVDLSWDASTSTDVSAYDLYRDAVLIAGITDLGNLSYRDLGLPNGVYTYHVVVRDQVGNQSVPSNAVSVTIDAPGSFDLSVSAAAEGSALTLDWVAPSGISPNQYRIFRAETAGGVYAEIGQVAGSVLSYADAGLENETARHYVVIAVDASAAVSTVSIEASGTPRDTAAPVLPVLLAPTRAGTIYLTTDDRVTITGSTEAGANVELVADGRNLLTTALAEPEVSYTQLRNLDSYSLSPDGQSLLYADRFPSRIRLYDFATETERQIYGSPENVDLNPQWFSDGKRIVFIDESASESRLFVRILDIADASLVDVTDPVTSNIVFATPSPDGAQLLLLGSFDDPGQSGLWLFDLNTGGKTLLREGRPYSFFVPVWSPDGNQVAYLNQDASPRTIEVYDLEGMVFQVVGEMTYSRSQLSWSPDSKALIYDRYDSIIRQDVISRYTPATGLTDILLSDPNANLRDPRWSPDGRQIAYFDTSSRQLHIRDIDTGADNILEDARGFTGLEQWGRSGQLLVFADFSFARLAPPGFFEFAGVDLKLGENEFAALATDAVGNVSSLADSIVVARSLGDLADLSVRPEDIVLLPAVPSVNQTARVGITIHNLGRRSSEPASFSVLAIDPTGQSIELVAPAVIGSLAPNRSRTVTADWPLGDTAGEYTLVVFVDGENSIAELNEANNTVIMPQLVGGEGGLSSTIALDAAEYTSGQPASIAFEISNSSDRFNGHYEVRIEDGQGVSVAQLRAEPVQNLLFGQSIVSTLEWNTSTTFAGAYRARLRVWDAENQLLVSESADFNINPSFLVEADVVTDRTRYSGNGNVRVTGTVNYPTGNVVLDGASASLRIFGINGGILLETVEPLAVLIPGASTSVSADWNTGLQSVGLYRVEIEVTQDARSVARAQSEFSIDADVLRLSGSLALADDSPDAGVIQQVSFSIENLGNAAIQQLPATISLLDPNAQAVLQSEVLQVDIGVNDASTGSVGFDTANLALVNYNLLLQVEVPDANGQPSLLNLASTSFTLQDRSPPLVTLLRPVASGFINSAEEMRFTAEDRLTAIALTAFQIDGGDWVGAVVRDATNNEYGADLPVLSETTHSIRARATDLAGNTGFSATVSFTVDNTAPQIAVEGVSDGVVYLDPVAPIITITETNLAETYIAINNEPFVSGTAIVAEGQYDLFVDVTDLAGNIAQTFLSFIIDGGAPLIEINGVADGQIVNTSVTPEIVVTDANLTQTSITLNGEGFVSGTEIIEEGEYQLQVTAADIAGNTTTQTLDFRIDLTAPTLVVSVPDDGAMVDAAMISISGQTEPAAIVALTAADMTRTSVVADASGLFVFDGVNLLVGDNLFTLTATDMAGNNSDELALSVIRIVAQQVELSGSLAVRPRVLAWMPGAYRRHDQTTTLPLEQMLVELFAEKGIDYQLTDNEADFKQALYSQRYNVVVIADAHPRGYRPGRNGYCYYDYHRRRHHGAGDDDDHDDDDDDEHEDDDDDDGYDDDDHGGYGNHYRRYRPRHLHLSHALKNRLRLNVAGGMGLVMISTHPYHGNNLSDVFGARIKGHGSVGPDGQIALIDSPLGEARVLARSSRGVRLKNLGGITVGTYQPEEKPALVINTYRSGKTALLGFDPAGLDDTEQAKTLLSDLFNFAAPQSLATFPGSVVDLQWTVSQAEPPLDVNLTQISDPQIGLLNVLDGEIVDAQTAVWQRIIEAEQDVFDAVIRLPFEKGDFSISADLSANVDGNLTSLQVAELLVSTERDLDDLGAALLTTMAAVEVDRRWEARLLRLATWLVRLALESPRDSRYAVDAALWYLTHAYKLVGQIRPGLFEVQSEIGLVYRLYQLERYRLGVDAGDW